MEHPLLHKIITKIELADDRYSIRFTLDDGEEIIARCYAECCSDTWIESVINHDAAVGSPVLRVVALDLWERKISECNWVTFYGLAIETANGRCTIDFRNSSNGYYGGELVWPGHWAYRMAEAPCGFWKPITE